jgi:hypothetical protein
MGTPDPELVSIIDELAQSAQRTLRYARAVQQRLGLLDSHPTTRPSDERGTILEGNSPVAVAIDDIPTGAYVHIHSGPRYPYASLSPEPSNVLQSPGLMDVVKQTYGAGYVDQTTRRTHAAARLDEQLGDYTPGAGIHDAADGFNYVRSSTHGYRDADGNQYHSSTCGRATGQCDCGAQSD